MVRRRDEGSGSAGPIYRPPLCTGVNAARMERGGHVGDRRRPDRDSCTILARPDAAGWGQVLGEFFDAHTEVRNFAKEMEVIANKSGRSNVIDAKANAISQVPAEIPSPEPQFDVGGFRRRI